MPQAAEDQTEAALGATFALRREHGTIFNVRGKKNPFIIITGDDLTFSLYFKTGSLCFLLYR
jgi:hypothetical protein